MVSLGMNGHCVAMTLVTHELLLTYHNESKFTQRLTEQILSGKETSAA